jgi:predicted dehydrogenase
MAADAAEAAAVVDAAHAAGVFAMEAMWSSYLPQSSIIRALLADDVLGTISVVTADFGANFFDEPDAIVFRPELAGGVLRDIGIYPLWFSSFVLGQPQQIVATGTLTDTGVDEQVAMILTAPSGAQSLLSTTMRADTPVRATISGTAARIEVDSPFLMPSGFTLYDATSSESLTWHDTSGLVGRDGLAWQAVAVAQHVADGLAESPVHPLDETLAILATLDEARRQVHAMSPPSLVE